MKRTTQIHIGGRHFFIDDDAFQKLNHYLESLKNHFAPDGDTGKEIVDDIEQRIAELLDARIANGKEAINMDDVTETIHTLGNVEDFIYSEDSTYEHRASAGSRKHFRRFFRDPDNYYVSGVCSGLGEYFNIDPLWIRLAFVVLFFAKGAGLLLYIILWIVVPKARTTAEKIQMRGKPVNLTTIKDSVNEEYERAKTDNPNERTRDAVDNILRTIGLLVVAFFKFLIAAIGVILIVFGSIFLAGLVMMLTGFTNIFGSFQFWGVDLPQLSAFFVESGHYYAALTALILLFLIPVIAMIYGGVKILFNIKSHHPVMNAFLFTAWILALILFVTLVIVNVSNSPLETLNSETTELETGKNPRLTVDIIDNTNNNNITHYRVFGHRFRYNRWNETLYDNPSLSITTSGDDKLRLTISRRIKNAIGDDADDFMDEIVYNWELNDSVLYLDKYFYTDDDDFWMFAAVELNLEIPKGQQISLTHETCDILEEKQKDLYCNNNTLKAKSWIMSPDGVLMEAK